MKTLFTLAAISFLTLSVSAAPSNIIVHAQLVELSGDIKLPKDTSRLSELKGADVFTSPKLETASGKPTKVSLMRDFTVPGKGKFQVGVLLRVRPTLEGAQVRYAADWEQTEFTGFAPQSDQAPMFTTRKVAGIEGDTALRKTVVLDLGSHEDKQTVSEPGKRSQVEPIRRHLFAILRFTTE